jgi:hypothetical protein
VVALRGILAAAAAVAIGSLSATTERAEAGAPGIPSFLLFSGTDFWRYGAFLYGGLIWSPNGLDNSGFTLKMLLDGGKYDYVSSGLQETVDGNKLSVAGLPGWRFSRGDLSVSFFGGPVVQDYRLTPNDPGSHLHGLYLGAEFATDIWYQPTPSTMAALNGAIASIGPTGYVRAAVGVRLFAPAFIGPETQAIWCGDYQEFQLGAHVTSLHVDAFEWSAGTGWAMTSDRRTSPYLHMSFSARY